MSIQIDSVGNIYKNNQKLRNHLNIRVLANGINDYVKKERITKYPGNDDIVFTEAPSPELNKQAIVITITFLDDIRRERHLRNKTYYSWGNTFDKDNKEYSIYNYLDEKEVKMLKLLLD